MKKLISAWLCLFLLALCVPTYADTTGVPLSEEDFFTIDFDQIDQRSAFAQENINIQAAMVSEIAGRSIPVASDTTPEVATFLLSEQINTNGVRIEEFLTVTRATQTSSGVEEAGNLTVVAMIYWNTQYSDDLEMYYDIAFIKSGHLYRDAGSSGVYQLYGENYVSIGTYFDGNERTWSNPSDNSTYTLTNNFSNIYTAMLMGNFNSTAITTVYANNHYPSALTVSINKNS